MTTKETDELLRDKHGQVVICSHCSQPKLVKLCDEVEFDCDRENRANACLGWIGSCCGCGAAYAKGQL